MDFLTAIKQRLGCHLLSPLPLAAAAGAAAAAFPPTTHTTCGGPLCPGLGHKGPNVAAFCYGAVGLLLLQLLPLLRLLLLLLLLFVLPDLLQYHLLVMLPLQLLVGLALEQRHSRASGLLLLLLLLQWTKELLRELQGLMNKGIVLRILLLLRSKRISGPSLRQCGTAAAAVK